MIFYNLVRGLLFGTIILLIVCFAFKWANAETPPMPTPKPPVTESEHEYQKPNSHPITWDVWVLTYRGQVVTYGAFDKASCYTTLGQVSSQVTQPNSLACELFEVRRKD